jgi:hypothetical protein
MEVSMSSWTVLTVRGREAKDYEYTRQDNTDPWDATADIAATMDEDRRVRRHTMWKGHVYAYLGSDPFEDEPAEAILEDYAAMVEDAVILHANDTTDQGKASYYPDPEGGWVDRFCETDHGYTGQKALMVVSSHRGIIARDPFHNTCGRLDGRYLEDGVVRD